MNPVRLPATPVPAGVPCYLIEMMKKFDAVVFDLDNTLYSYDKAHAAAWAALLALAQRELSLSPERFGALHAEASRILTERCGGGPAIHNRLIRFQILLELAQLPFGRAPELADCYWNTLLRAMEPEPGARETLLRLKQMGLRTGVGTNMTADRQFDKLRLLGLTPYVDFLVTSEELGVEKPDARLFALCAQKAGTVPERCVFVGDSLTKDASAAQAAGMQGVWYCPGAERQAPEGIWTVRTLPEIPEYL